MDKHNGEPSSVHTKVLPDFRASLKMHFFRDGCVSSVLESSCMTYTLRFSARCFLALTKKLLFLEMPLFNFLKWPMNVSKVECPHLNSLLVREDNGVPKKYA